MKKLRSVYHKPEGERGIGKWIVGWTWALGLFYNWGVLKYNYSHEELWLPDESGRFYDSNGNIVGTCFSSTTRGDSTGVRFASASEVLDKHPERWEYVEFEIADVHYNHTREAMKDQLGLPYDWWAVSTGFVSPVYINPEAKWFCSEICCWAKWYCNVLDKLWRRISPRRSAYIMAKKYHKPKAV